MDSYWYNGKSVERITDRVLANSIHRIFHDKQKIWIDIAEPSTADFNFLATFLGAHPRTIEAIRKGTTRPHVEEYPTYSFISLYGIDDHSHFTNVHFLLGEHFLVSIRKRNIRTFEILKKDHNLLKALLGHDTEWVMHSLVESEVSKYGAILEQIDKEISSIEDRVVKENGSELVHSIFRIKHHLITIKHHLNPQKEVLYEISRRRLKYMMQSAADHFRDVHMQVLSANDAIDNYREILNGALDVHLSVTSNHLNDVIKVLTVFSTIFLPLTLIASIYGMNFQHMPELAWKYGYAFAMGIMVLIGVIMTIYFRRKKWI